MIEGRELLFEIEREHWWFESRRKIVYDLFWKKYFSKQTEKLKILSIGTSSGVELEFLSKFGNVLGIDLDEKMVLNAQKNGLNVLKQDILSNNFKDNSFDIVFAMDVLEHIEDHEKAFKEAFRVLRSGGYMFITVPACKFLWSNHDEHQFFPHKRRYNKKDFLVLLRTQNVEILKCSFFNFFLFPFITLVRLLNVSSDSQLKIPNKFVNSFFKTIFSSERYFLNKINFPIGVSLIAICRKKCAE
ncbi:MAG: methyltransferase family protein [candidate division TM6 bacterium GW2011_GWE2_31_21]|nr:MAG: methyltransferase family protein [candidate division TM6 bacterium GW2011_GWE2_31_21]KKP53905.1 MAG: methyltransferase family protein [candidate division TM6 bacterium GW2011_GWF2_33_332]